MRTTLAALAASMTSAMSEKRRLSSPATNIMRSGREANILANLERKQLYDRARSKVKWILGGLSRIPQPWRCSVPAPPLRRMVPILGTSVSQCPRVPQVSSAAADETCDCRLPIIKPHKRTIITCDASTQLNGRRAERNFPERPCINDSFGGFPRG